MVGAKSSQTRAVGIIADEMYPYTFIMECPYHPYFFSALENLQIEITR